MGRYLAALLGGGANEHGSVLKPETMAMMFAPQYQPDTPDTRPGPGVLPRHGRRARVLEHQGVVPAFTSQIFLAPDDRLGLMAFTNGTRNGLFWLPVETGRLFHSLLGAPDEAIRTDVPHHPEIWADLCGSYHLPGPLTDVRVRGMAEGGCRGLRPPRPALPRGS